MTIPFKGDYLLGTHPHRASGIGNIRRPTIEPIKQWHPPAEVRIDAELDRSGLLLH
jgi:hypothetical protein